ncbi:uncharacterized protein LOC143299580 [Babylonia areolata]|uniref:uncharacterized protein LOC143299580 n=1 Tax=Babylonia areolata TaxID=304850 RepID=UPI003FCFC7D4
MRASVNRSTGLTPNKMMLGREVNMPGQLMFPVPGQTYEDQDVYVSELVKNLQQAHAVARQTLNTSQKAMKRNYDLKILLRPYAEGDVVYLLDTAASKGKCRKLCSPWKGPGVIVKKLSAYLYRVKLRNAVFVTNHDRMAPCRDRKIPAWITQHHRRADDPPEETDDNNQPYCLCRRPWEGRFMIQCDYCQEWYHGSCVNITATDALDIDKYKCESCVHAGR